MPHPSEPLKNVRHEKFCLALAQGMSQASAYQHASFKETASSRANAARLIAIDSVRERLEHLQTMAAKGAEITIASICAELDEANAVAKERGQASAMVNASALRARLAGLLTQKIEITNQRGDYDEADEVVVARLAQYCGGRRKLTETAISIAVLDVQDGFSSGRYGQSLWRRVIFAACLIGLTVGVTSGVRRSIYVAESLDENAAGIVVENGKFLFGLYEKKPTIPESRRQAVLAHLNALGIRSREDVIRLRDRVDALELKPPMFLEKYHYLSF